jgi:hypothetical protein
LTFPASILMAQEVRLNFIVRVIRKVQMLEYWYKERRTLIDFRRGVLGPYFDSFAEYLKAKGFPRSHSREILGKCCQFNSYLVEQKITRCSLLTDKLVESFLDVYFEHYGSNINIRDSPKFR